MSHRTQLTLEDEQYERLLALADESGLSLAELVRRAVDRVYGPGATDGRLRALDLSFGGWAAIEVDGEAYVEQRRHGLARRLAESSAS